ncbi:MAG: hypothetical protein CL912_14085 [Deltaproteobacteria bacterium]|nr:hypothetical protein [Deltaproteobacteria bacterium]
MSGSEGGEEVRVGDLQPLYSVRGLLLWAAEEYEGTDAGSYRNLKQMQIKHTPCNKSRLNACGATPGICKLKHIYNKQNEEDP